MSSIPWITGNRTPYIPSLGVQVVGHPSPLNLELQVTVPQVLQPRDIRKQETQSSNSGIPNKRTPIPQTLRLRIGGHLQPLDSRDNNSCGFKVIGQTVLQP